MKSWSVQKNGDLRKARSTGGATWLADIGRRGFKRNKIGDARMTIIRATTRSVFTKAVSTLFGSITGIARLTHPSEAEFVKDSLQDQRHYDTTSKISSNCNANR